MSNRKIQHETINKLSKSEYAFEQSDDEGQKLGKQNLHAVNLQPSPKNRSQDEIPQYSQIKPNIQPQQYVQKIDDLSISPIQPSEQQKNSDESSTHKKYQQVQLNQREEQQKYPHLDINFPARQSQSQIEEEEEEALQKATKIYEQSSKVPNQQNTINKQQQIQNQFHSSSEKNITKEIKQIQKPMQILQKQNKKQQLIQYYDNEDVKPQINKKHPHLQCQYEVKFIKYNFEYFLKIQTQVFTIQVTIVQSQTKTYQIRRRFSDFVFLFEAITVDHPGFIIYPFPQKNFQTFIKLKLNIQNKTQGEKIQLIEKRMQELQKFTHFIIQHPQLSHCEEIYVFLQKDQQFEKDRKRLQNYITQYRQLETQSLKNLIEKGANFISSYLKNDQMQKKPHTIRKKDLQFGIYLDITQNNLQKINRLLDLSKRLMQVQTQFTQFSDIETDIDELLKLCAKHTSGKEYSRYFLNWLSNELIEFLNLKHLQFNQIEAQLQYRNQLSQLSQYLEDRIGQRQRYQKIKRRISKFQINFKSSWSQFRDNFENNFTKYNAQFMKVWNKYRKNMCKIWAKEDNPNKIIPEKEHQ